MTGEDREHKADDKLEAMIKEMNKATLNAENTIDRTVDFIAASNKRIAKMERQARRGAA